MFIKKGSSLTVKIDKHIFPGKGLGEFDNRRVIVPNGIPGDTLEIIVTRAKKNLIEGRTVRIVAPSPLRHKAPCTHYPLCGGCQLIDLPYDKQLELKMNALMEDLNHHYPQLSDKLAPIIGCKHEFHYRNKMEFSFGTQTDQRVIGLKQRGHFDRVVPIEKCFIQPNSVNPILQRLIELINTNTSLTCWNPHTHTGDLRHCVMRHSHTTQSTLLNIVVSRNIKSELEPIVAKLIQEFPQLSGVFMSLNTSPGDHTHFESSDTLHGQNTLVETVGHLKFTLPFDAFFQTNSAQMVLLYDYVKQAANFKPTDRLLDLYCGIGTIGLYCADAVESVIGIEENTSAIHWANQNQRLNHIENAQFYEGRVKNILKFNTFDPTVLIIDPPRAGMVPKALRRIIALDTPKIIYVSCNPSTCWRDLAEFEAHGYQIESIQPVDMFPHTFHVETVTVLHKKNT